MPNKKISVLPQRFTIHRLGPTSEIPTVLVTAKYCWIARTQDELSVVCEDSVPVESEQSETGWNCLAVCGPIPFTEIGITAGLSTELARAGVSMFGLATFDTDYFLVRSSELDRAMDALRSAGWDVRPADPE